MYRGLELRVTGYIVFRGPELIAFWDLHWVSPQLWKPQGNYRSKNTASLLEGPGYSVSRRRMKLYVH